MWAYFSKCMVLAYRRVSTTSASRAEVTVSKLSLLTGYLDSLLVVAPLYLKQLSAIRNQFKITKVFVKSRT